MKIVYKQAWHTTSFNGAILKQQQDRERKAVRQVKATAIRAKGTVIDGGCQLFTLPAPKGKRKNSKPKKASRGSR